ncbi:MAG: type IX secretion system membrane protein PorP/SprF, partial [Bacteroidetes bacterium]
MSFFAIAMYGQQDPIYTQYMFNTLAVNPAYAGSRDVLSATMLYRHQWIIEGAPRTLTFSADMPVANEKVGLGLVVSNDNIGVFNTLSASANFAYRIRFEKTTLAFGILGGFSQINANLPSTGLTSDPAFAQSQNHFVPNIGAGVYWSSDRFYVGASLPKMLNTNIYETLPVLNSPAGDGFKSRQFRHAFITGGYVFNLSEHVKLKPSTLIRFVSGAPAQLDLNCNLYLYDKFGIGLSARSAAQLGFAKSALGLF